MVGLKPKSTSGRIVSPPRKCELPNMTGHALPANPRPVHVGGQSPSALAARSPSQGLLSYWLGLYRMCQVACGRRATVSTVSIPTRASRTRRTPQAAFTRRSRGGARRRETQTPLPRKVSSKVGPSTGVCFSMQTCTCKFQHSLHIQVCTQTCTCKFASKCKHLARAQL